MPVFKTLRACHNILMQFVPMEKEGLRGRKRRETLHRIAETGLKLFVENGYDATTLESVAAASGISARTLFYYFGSKYEILQFWFDFPGGGLLNALRPLMIEEVPNNTPLVSVRNCLLQVVSRFETEKSLIVDRLMQSTEALRMQMQMIFVEMEEDLLTVLGERWPLPERRPTLRMVAMIAIGAMRLAMVDWRQENGARPLAEYLRDSYDVLETQV